MADIDFVVTWVDGSAPDMVQARAQARAELDGKGKGRYQDNGEIYYLIASILKYAPFVRRVFIVTDNQKPQAIEEFAAAGLCSADWIQVVSHDTIFDGFDMPRPTFNSRTIEAALWRIPGLSEHFVYSNDDMFLNAPLVEEDFFRNGKPVIHGSLRFPGEWFATVLLRRTRAYLQGKPAPDSPTHGRAQERGARLAGVTGRFLLPHHNPHPMRRSTAEAFFAERPEVVRAQMQHRFRHSSQYLQVALSNHLERRKHGVSFHGWREVAYLDPGRSSEQIEHTLAVVRDAKAPFGCVQSLERFKPPLRARIHAVLRDKFRAELPQSIALETGTKPLGSVCRSLVPPAALPMLADASASPALGALHAGPRPQQPSAEGFCPRLLVAVPGAAEETSRPRADARALRPALSAARTGAQYRKA